jgi:AraC family transcriptional regulator
MNERPHAPANPSFTTTTMKGKTMFDVDQVVIRMQPEIKVLALEHIGDYQTIGRSFDKLMAWAAGRNLLDQPMRCFALYYDDPMSKPREQLRSEACLAPERSHDLAAVVAAAPPAGGPQQGPSAPSEGGQRSRTEGKVRATTIPAGRCATFLFKGPYSDLDKPYRWLYDTWLAQSGEELAFEPPYEEYVNDARTTPPPELLTRICLPLKG